MPPVEIKTAAAVGLGFVGAIGGYFVPQILRKIRLGLVNAEIERQSAHYDWLVDNYKYTPKLQNALQSIASRINAEYEKRTNIEVEMEAHHPIKTPLAVIAGMVSAGSLPLIFMR